MNEQEAKKLRELIKDLIKEIPEHYIVNETLIKINKINDFIFSLVDKKRTNNQNAKHWADVMEQIAEQVSIHDKKYDKETWHEQFKRLFLPEESQEGITTEKYKKWMALPSGKYHLIGSTTQLTKKGFSEYMQRVEHYAATELGVTFYAK